MKLKLKITKQLRIMVAMPDNKGYIGFRHIKTYIWYRTYNPKYLYKSFTTS